jgi:hypothetical protein
VTPAAERNRSKRGKKRPERPEAPAPATGLGGWWRERRRRLHAWWADLLEQARKK